jgi:hypothetical protein
VPWELPPYLVYALLALLGAGLAALDRRWTGWPVCGALAAAGVLGGYALTRASPFTFAGGDYYMEGVILAFASALALGGYVLSSALHFAIRRVGSSSGRGRSGRRARSAPPPPA